MHNRAEISSEAQVKACFFIVLNFGV